MHWRCHRTTRFELKRRLKGAGLQKFIICQKRFPFKLEFSFFPFVLLKVEFLLYLFVHGLCWCVWFIVWKRRRSRINEKLKALQNLIPNSNKVVIFALRVFIYIIFALIFFFKYILYLRWMNVWCCTCMIIDWQSFNAGWGYRISQAASTPSTGQFSLFI